MTNHPLTDQHQSAQETFSVLDLATERCLDLIKQKITDVVVTDLTLQLEKEIRSATEKLLADLTIEQLFERDLMPYSHRLQHIIRWERNKESTKRRVEYKSEVVDVTEEDN